LLVERGGFPGKGLWALPGGHVKEDQTALDAAITELVEETGLKVPEKVLKGSIKNTKLCDDPNRSTRKRTVSVAFHFELEALKKLHKVRGGDEAKKAFWVPLEEVPRNKMFEDHFLIISEFTGIN